jgi:hypothetical protein
MMQARDAACIIIRVLLSKIEFQRQLYIPRGLGTCDLSDRRPQSGVGRVVLDMVKGVDEVGTELQLEPLGKREVLVQTHIHVGVMR